jgi:signal transduction histidine kinase/DNA-binding response OmpR family regulator/CHASE3 domain sensor protein
MRGVIKKRLNTGFVVAIILVLLIGAISFSTFKRQSEESEHVNHTYQVIGILLEIQQSLIDMETGQRGFRSTNEKVFLEPYRSGVKRYPTSVARLETLIQDNPQQVQKAEKVKESIEELLNFWQDLDNQQNTFSNQRVIEIMRSEKLQMDVIREQLGDMRGQEENLLQARKNENRQSVEQAKWELFIGIVLILTIVVLLINQIVREFKHRRKAEASLQENLEELTAVNDENAEKNWLLTGMADVNNVLQADVDEETLTDGVLKAVINYLGQKAGAFYVYDAERNKLVLKAAFSVREIVQKEYELHEGFVGQAAASREPMILDKITTKNISFNTATLSVSPVNAIYAPLVYNDELKGVIEVLCFDASGQKVLKFLKVITNNISVALHSLQSRQKVLQLLAQVQEQKLSLENQQEELRQSNEELTVQAEVLQASEEELRVQEEELKQINDELNEKNQAIDNARQSLLAKAAELESASKYKSEFLANMSHELRTPLNSVLILAKLLAENKENNLTEKQVSHAKIIHKSGNDLLDLINDILDLSKIEAGKVDLLIEDVAVKTIANDLGGLFSVVADEKGIEYNVTIDENVPQKIKTDKQKVDQVLKNLLSNAFKFTPEKGKVNVSFSTVVEDGETYLSISVSDTGIGIAPEKQRVIFEAFQQADGSTNRRFGGTGLGLSITKELVRMLQGKVKLVSAPNQGSTFTVYMPLAVAVPEKTASIPTENPVASFPTSVVEQTKVKDDRNTLSGADKVMLIIEDDANFAEIINVFARENGYKTLVALSGDEGWYYAKKIKPSAIILDLYLPVYNGETLLKIFREDDELKNVPIHVISAATNDKDLNGAIAFLNKPVAKEDLEKAFKLISDHLQASVKKVMIISKNNLKNDINTKFFKKNDVILDESSTVEEAIYFLKKTRYDCIIADIGNNIKEGILQLNTLNAELLPHRIPTIIYLDNDITVANELELKRVADVVVRKSSFSNIRLLDELELFLYKVEENNTKPSKRTINSINNDTTLQNKKALLVDDDMRNIFALSAILEQEKIEVITASNGREALEALSKNKGIHIVLMDVMMPEMDGYEAICHIRKEMKLHKLPIIALTAKAMAGDKDKCIAAGASDYISKPVDMQKLISLMRVWLS